MRSQRQPEEPRRVSFGHDDDGSWRLSAVLPPDEGALVEQALAEARDELFRALHPGAEQEKPGDVSWADALVAVAERSLGAAAAERPHRDRHLVWLHVRTGPAGATEGRLHLGPVLPDGLRRLVGCDAKVRAVFEEAGAAVTVGRALRTAPDRTRMVIEDRDRACRVPGCERTRWLQVHHIRHWEDGGATDTPNLLALCGLCRCRHKPHYADRLIMPTWAPFDGIYGGARRRAVGIIRWPRGRR